MTDFILALLGAALVNNLALTLPLGIDPLLRATAPRQRLHALGLASTCLLVLAVPLDHLLYRHLLLPLQLDYLHLFIALPLAAALIYPVLALLRRWRPTLDCAGLEPLLLINGGVLGLALLGVERTFSQVLALSLGGGLGFWLVLVLFDDLRNRIRQQDVPVAFRDAPIELISAGLMALAFLGFGGLVK